jgi:Domain of unknown function (DUF4440)
MDGPLDVEGLAAELDAAHARAREAYGRRDAAGYLGAFHPELQYAQPDGQTIDRARLARAVRAQLARAHCVTTDYRRESLEPLPDGGAREVLEQRAAFRVRAFGVLNREWSVRRRGRYEWARTPDGWQIRRVEVLAEDVTARTWLGFG